MSDNNNYDIATKGSVELNSKYSNYTKHGSTSGSNTTESILNIVRQQSIQSISKKNNNKESE